LLEAATEVDLGGVSLRLIPFAAAHTPGPLVVHIPQDRVVYAGDVLYRGRLPAVIEGGSVKTWLEGFERLREFGDVTFVPGHGQPGKLSDFEFSTRDYLRMLRAHMTRSVEQGRDMQDAMKSLDQSRFAKLANFQDLAGRNASIAYIEAEAEAFR
jgi:glyoxylase-like metal-dependent hydrolase (beta-lactamase superfamily II)